MQCLLTAILLALWWRPRLRQLSVNLLVHWWLCRGPLKSRRRASQRYRKTKVQFDAADCGTQGALPSRKKPAWVLAEVLQLAVHLQTPRAIAYNFNRLYGQRMTVGKTWVHARCRENSEVIAAMRRGMKGKPPRFGPPSWNGAWT